MEGFRLPCNVVFTGERSRFVERFDKYAQKGSLIFCGFWLFDWKASSQCATLCKKPFPKFACLLLAHDVDQSTCTTYRRSIRAVAVAVPGVLRMYIRTEYIVPCDWVPNQYLFKRCKPCCFWNAAMLEIQNKTAIWRADALQNYTCVQPMLVLKRS